MSKRSVISVNVFPTNVLQDVHAMDSGRLKQRIFNRMMIVFNSERWTFAHYGEWHGDCSIPVSKRSSVVTSESGTMPAVLSLALQQRRPYL